MLKKYFGDKKFYRMVLTFGMPIMIQNGITNFVSLLDNIMVGRLGTEPMSGVSIINTLIFVFNLCIFGGVSGPGIFSAQYYGKRDHEGIRYCFRFKFVLGILLSALAAGIFCFGGEMLIDGYLQGEIGEGNPVVIMKEAKDYLWIIILGLLPFAVTQVYSSTLREQGETLVPMVAGVIAVGVNLLFNWILIFGELGFTAMGVRGAAIATVISRIVELLIVIFWTHRHKERYPFIVGAFKSLRLPKKLFRDIVIKSTPLLLNECLWAAGMAMLNSCYSLRGTDVIAAININSTIFNIFNIIFMSFGTAISIVVGPMLGTGENERAVDTARKMITFSFLISVVVGVIMIVTAPLFPLLFNVEDSIRTLAASLLMVTGSACPLNGFVHASYFTIRSGGKTVITFLFDSAFTWCVTFPFALLLTKCTDLPIVPLFFCCQWVEIIKCVVAFILIKKKIWLNNIVE